MPELPDVETFRRYINSHALHQRVQSVQVTDKAILAGATAWLLQTRLEGRKFKSTRRHGKNLFVEISGASEWLRFHFGMTGWPAYVKDGGELPRYSRVIFHFNNRRRLAYVDPRKFGSVGLVKSIPDYVRSKNLGPDALKISASDFQKRLKTKRGHIKSVLMDQQVIAGIGNVYADELLFRSQAHPKIRVESLGQTDLSTIYKSMQSVLKKAVACKADVGSFSRMWLLPHRRRGKKCPRCGTIWQFIKVGGRTTCLCPRCQNTKP